MSNLGYHKFPGEDWPEGESLPAQVRLPSGERVTMDLAERGTCLSNGLWVRELRKRTERGHQTAILCTDYRSEAAPLGVAMFARWSQENFFKYARENFGLDRLVDYRTESVSDPLQVVNPDYRHLDGKVRSATGKLTRRLAKFAAMTLQEPIEPKHVEPICGAKPLYRRRSRPCSTTSTPSRPSARRLLTTSGSMSCPRRHLFASSVPTPSSWSIPSK
jgi:hypothetical protein